MSGYRSEADIGDELAQCLLLTRRRHRLVVSHAREVPQLFRDHVTAIMYRRTEWSSALVSRSSRR